MVLYYNNNSNNSRHSYEIRIYLRQQHSNIFYLLLERTSKGLVIQNPILLYAVLVLLNITLFIPIGFGYSIIIYKPLKIPILK